MSATIGITAGEIYNKTETWAPVTYGQARTYCDAIISANGVPFILPLTDNESALRVMYEHVDGILFSGGNDVNPVFYGEKARAKTKNISEYRDNYEKQLMTWAFEDKKPILAICRGVQLLNIFCGGSLYQDLPSEYPGVENHLTSSDMKDVEYLAHTLRILPTSKLAAILKTSTIAANAHHHQAIKQLAPALRATAWAQDGVIEAVEGIRDESFIIGVQSHPESLYMRAEQKWLALFQAFVRAASQT